MNDTHPPEFFTLSLHDALPICVLVVGRGDRPHHGPAQLGQVVGLKPGEQVVPAREENVFAGHRAMVMIEDATTQRSEEHTSELQSRRDLVCRLLLEKKNLRESI